MLTNTEPIIFNTEVIKPSIYVSNYEKFQNKLTSVKPEDITKVHGRVTDIKTTPNGNVITINNKIVVKECYFSLVVGYSYEFSVLKSDIIYLDGGYKND